ncbi:unnamed protein product [Allacma fusca]|uniref:Adenylate kinase n=1 Tax=Allacma fusca TaxID=39272 RepID=A0A8J2LMP6_9HEXA|nr:unnamed protein product [Allacma fusca]
MDPGLDSEVEDEFNEEDEGGEIFAIGTVVFPVDREKDNVDPRAVLINHSDTFVGRNLAVYLASKKIGGNEEWGGEGGNDEVDGEGGEGGPMKGNDDDKYWKLLGTLKNPNQPDPQYLWATVVTDDFDAYINELLKCSVIIYDITDDSSQERIDEIRKVCDALRAKVPVYGQKRVFILISSLHSWSHTTRPKEADFRFTEANYRRRRTKPMYRELQLLERYVVASGKMTRGMLKSYVIGAGAIYGDAEDALHTWFKSGWHNAKNLPIYGDGKNLMPTIYIQNLARIVQQVMDKTPKNQRYIIAVDPVLCTQEQIVKAISKALGTGQVKNVPEKDIYLNRELTTFQADQVLLDLPIESTFCQDNFDVDWTAENGIKSIMQLVVEEYRRARGLIPIKLILVGPPGIGKSTVARQIADIYHFHHFDDETMVETTVELLKEIAATPEVKPNEEEEEQQELRGEMDEEDDDKERQAAAAKRLLNEVDECLRLNQKISEEVLAKLYRYRLKTNPVKNQGYVLDGYPHTADDAKTLLSLGETRGEDEAIGEDDRDILDPQILPDHVVFLEAPDEFILDRLAKVPIEQLLERHHEDVFPKLLSAFHHQEEDYDKTFVAYLNEQEILYDPIDVSKDLSEMMQKTTAKISYLLGKPRNYGLSAEEEAAIRNAQRCERAEMDKRLREDMDLIKTRLLEARRKNMEQWMEQLEKAKRDEFEREEAAMIPLRHYLMAHVVPTLTKGLIDITRLRPEDPIDYLAEFLFQNNPGGVNPCARETRSRKKPCRLVQSLNQRWTELELMSHPRHLQHRTKLNRFQHKAFGFLKDSSTVAV